MTVNSLVISVFCTFVLHFISCDISPYECGTTQFIGPTIVKGVQTPRGAWPFLAALYSDDNEFFCGSTLISTKNVLTAAHCMYQKTPSKKLAPQNVHVLLGAHNLDIEMEKGTQRKDVEKIFIHPYWDTFDDKYDGDVAILVLSSVVEFTNYIRPICLTNEDVPADVTAWIAGWGLSENTTKKHEPILRHSTTKVLNDSYCYTESPSIAVLSTIRMFCGTGDGGAPHQGDSGGGAFILSGSSWVQYGIISATLSDARGNLMPNSFAIYTRVNLFMNWIENVVKNSGTEVLEVRGKERIRINECERIKFIDPKITNATHTARGAWPFSVALYYIEDSNYFCGGTLISTKNVLTAANCMYNRENEKLTPEEIAVLLGAYNLELRFEKSAERRFVEEIYVYPDWNVNDFNMDGDLAILALALIVEFTVNIRPICMPTEDVDFDTAGWVAGYGLKKSMNTSPFKNILHPAPVILLNETYCFEKNDLAHIVSSNRTFCGEDLDEGDRGGGLFVVYGSTIVQHGIVSTSASLFDVNTGDGDINKIAVYTNLYRYIDWISEMAIKSGSAVMTVHLKEEIVSRDVSSGGDKITKIHSFFLVVTGACTHFYISIFVI